MEKNKKESLGEKKIIHLHSLDIFVIHFCMYMWVYVDLYVEKLYEPILLIGEVKKTLKTSMFYIISVCRSR